MVVFSRQFLKKPISGRTKGSLLELKELQRKADQERDRRNYFKAATLYEAFLAYYPGNGPIHVQCGHMYKECSEFGLAERHYSIAHELMPKDADLKLQLGHYYKIIKQPSKALEFYAEAAKLNPAWDAPQVELASINGQDQHPPQETSSGEVKFEVEACPEGGQLDLGQVIGSLHELVESYNSSIEAFWSSLPNETESPVDLDATFSLEGYARFSVCREDLFKEDVNVLRLVQRMYRALLKRSGSVTELEYYRGKFRSGSTLDSILDEILRSNEAREVGVVVRCRGERSSQTGDLPCREIVLPIELFSANSEDAFQKRWEGLSEQTHAKLGAAIFSKILPYSARERTALLFGLTFSNLGLKQKLTLSGLESVGIDMNFSALREIYLTHKYIRSPVFSGDVIPLSQLVDQEDDARSIFNAYRCILRRDPDPWGFVANLVDLRNKNVKPLEMINAVASSEEAKAASTWTVNTTIS